MTIVYNMARVKSNHYIGTIDLVWVTTTSLCGRNTEVCCVILWVDHNRPSPNMHHPTQPPPFNQVRLSARRGNQGTISMGVQYTQIIEGYSRSPMNCSQWDSYMKHTITNMITMMSVPETSPPT